MAVTTTGTLKVSVATTASDVADLSTPQERSTVASEITLAAGTSNSQINQTWEDTRTVGPASNDDLDLTALTQSYFGVSGTKAFSKVRIVYIKNNSTTTGEYLNIGAAGANPWAGPFGAANDIAKVGPNSVLLLSNIVDGWTVTNASSDVLRISNPGAIGVSYSIKLVGLS